MFTGVFSLGAWCTCTLRHAALLSIAVNMLLLSEGVDADDDDDDIDDDDDDDDDDNDDVYSVYNDVDCIYFLCFYMYSTLCTRTMKGAI